MINSAKLEKRAVLICWKTQPGKPIEIFSNLKVLCLSYPRFKYHTLNNYLGKARLAYENDAVKIERLPIHSRPIVPVTTNRSIAMVVNRQTLKGSDEKEQDLNFWLTRPPIERLHAVASLVAASLKKGQRMEKVLSQRQQFR